MPYQFRSAVHLFLIKDDRILLQRRYNTGYMDGHYSVIAGHLEGGESTKNAMVREAREEAGIGIDKDDLDLVHIMHRASDEERIDFFFTCKSWEGKPEILEPDKADELKWVLIGDLPDMTIPYVRKAIHNYLHDYWFDTIGL